MDTEAARMPGVINRSQRFRFDDGPFKWAVGITTSPRRNPTLNRCVESVKKAGFAPQVFDDHDSSLGRMGNWIRTVRSLLESDANTIMVIQDDCVFCRNVREFLDRDLWPDCKTGLVSVYNCGHENFEKSEVSGCVCIPHRVLCGAVTFIIPRHAAELLVGDLEWVDGLASDSSIDLTVGIKTSVMGLNRYYYKPSMVQHIGLCSTSSEDKFDKYEARRSFTFIGEESCAIREYERIGYF